MLAERTDATYDAYQIKTRCPEIGDWTLGDEAMRHSIKRFVELHLKFGASIQRFVIVSHANFATFGLRIKGVRKLKGSLVRLLEAVQKCRMPTDMQTPFSEVLTDTATEYGCAIAGLFAVHGVLVASRIMSTCYKNPTLKPLAKLIVDFQIYVEQNSASIVEYSKRQRYGERVSIGFVESAVNQALTKRFVKRQRMQWTKKGAHLLVQARQGAQ